MSINVDEIEKYIFNPEYPKQCLSYKLLLRIANKNPYSFISPEFLQYYFKDDLLNQNFKNELWDVPSDFDTLNVFDKLELYKSQLSEAELKEFVDGQNIKFEKLMKYPFLDNLVQVSNRNLHLVNDKEKYIKRKVILNDNNIYESQLTEKFSGNVLILSHNYLEILELTFSHSVIFITLEKNIDSFLEYKSKNVKPIFLKKISDIGILFNILFEDINNVKQNKIKKEEIPYLNNINIKNFFSIKDLSVENISDKKEIYILGENGDGKTLFLQAIAVALKGSQRDGQEIFRKIKNEYNLSIEDTNKNIYNGLEIEYKNLFAYGANRNNNCQMLEDESGFLTLFDNKLDLKNPLKWLQKIDYKENRGDETLLSVNDAKNLLKVLLNSDVEIDISPDNVVFKEKGSIVSFEQLSAGYKGVITILADLLVRLSENQPYVKDIKNFKGIVLIDEVELHLHPKWKYDFVKKIRSVFPNIQFIMTTHSPTVLLGASKEAVFYKIYKEGGEVHISNQILNEGYTNNTLLSSPLFDMDTVKSRHYDLDKKSLSNDDMAFEKIHEVISEKIKNESDIEKDEISKLIDEEISRL